jgi:putative glutamine amidotransferase
MGITCSFEADEDHPARMRSYLNAAYSDAIFAAGGIPQPIPLPPEPDPELIREILEIYDGLLFTGGADLNPRRYGQAVGPNTHVLHERRDRFDIELFRHADRADKPILSICLGCQIANVARGGELVQHVDDLKLSCPVRHYQPDHASAYHMVRIEPDSLLPDSLSPDSFR